MELQSCYIFSSNFFFRFVRRRRRQTRNCCVACGNVRVSQHPSYAMCSTGSLIATATRGRHGRFLFAALLVAKISS